MLLELRTASGAVYVAPSWWQRLRLHWTFRHFHALPPQVLSRRDRRLIEKLFHSAVVKPALPVASDAVFGVVEEASWKQPPGRAVVSIRAKAAPEPSAPLQTSNAFRYPEEWGLSDIRLWQWGAAAAILAFCVALVLTGTHRTGAIKRAPAQLPGAAVEPTAPNGNASPLAASPMPAPPPPAAALDARRPAARKAALPTARAPAPQPLSANEPAPPIPAPSPTAAAPAAVVPSAAPEPPFVSELPQPGFAGPAISGRNLAGDLRLKVWIAADGTVKDVTVLSGDPKLGQAGMRAVRQWRFAPYQTPGGPAEAQTEIKMSFFGPDAVSISSPRNSSGP
ncbi:MAG TPA: TonB family protein [Acidobacteriaceae bacterium]|nr:TonB family protein [Acidobacteriaceae bacterium]